MAYNWPIQRWARGERQLMRTKFFLPVWIDRRWWRNAIHRCWWWRRHGNLRLIRQGICWKQSIMWIWSLLQRLLFRSGLLRNPATRLLIELKIRLIVTDVLRDIAPFATYLREVIYCQFLCHRSISTAKFVITTQKRLFEEKPSYVVPFCKNEFIACRAILFRSASDRC